MTPAGAVSSSSLGLAGKERAVLTCCLHTSEAPTKCKTTLKTLTFTSLLQGLPTGGRCCPRLRGQLAVPGGSKGWGGGRAGVLLATPQCTQLPGSECTLGRWTAQLCLYPVLTLHTSPPTFSSFYVVCNTPSFGRQEPKLACPFP